MDRFENLPAQTREQLSIKREQLRQWRLTSTNDTRLNRQTGLIASRNTARVTTKHRQP